MPFDPTITQKVREALIEDGHAELVVEGLAEHFKAVEVRLERLERDAQLAKLAEQHRVTDSGVHRIVIAHRNKDAVDWLKWVSRAALLGAGGFIARLAWKGLHG